MPSLNGSRTYHEALRRDLGGNAHVLDERNGSMLIITCEGVEGGHDVTLPIGRSHASPEKLSRKLRQLGWQTGQHVICNTCRQQRKAPMATTVEQSALQTPLQKQSDAAKRATRICFQALEDYYDDAKKCYRQGWSDDKIGEEIGMAGAAVAKVREDHFGPIAEPDVILELRGRLDLIYGSIRSAQQHIDAAKAEADAIRRQLVEAAKLNGWRVA